MTDNVLNATADDFYRRGNVPAGFQSGDDEIIHAMNRKGREMGRGY